MKIDTYVDKINYYLSEMSLSDEEKLNCISYWTLIFKKQRSEYLLKKAELIPDPEPEALGTGTV